MDYLSASNSMVLNVLALSAEGWESSGPVVMSQSLSNQGCLSTLLFQKYFIFINEMRQCPIRAKK